MLIKHVDGADVEMSPAEEAVFLMDQAKLIPPQPTRSETQKVIESLVTVGALTKDQGAAATIAATL